MRRQPAYLRMSSLTVLQCHPGNAAAACTSCLQTQSMILGMHLAESQSAFMTTDMQKRHIPPAQSSFTTRLSVLSWINAGGSW